MNENLRKYRWLQAERIKGLCLAQLSQFNEAAFHLQSAVDGCRDLLKSNLDPLLHHAVIHDLGVTLFSLSFLYYNHGNILLAKTYAHESLVLWRGVKTNIIQIGYSLNAIGYMDYETGQYRLAWEAFQEATEMLKPIEAGSTPLYNYLLHSVGDLQRDLDEWDQAAETYQKSIAIAKGWEAENRAFGAYDGLSVLETWRGNFTQATHNLREAARIRKIPPESPEYQIRLGAIYLEMGQNDLAIQAFQQVLSEWKSLKFPHKEAALATFLLGRAYYAKKQPEEALNCLQTSLLWAAQLGYDQFLVIWGRRSRAFIDYAVQTWPDNPQILSLVSRVGTFKSGLAQLQTKSISVEQQETHLEIFAFGPGNIRRDGKLIPKFNWRGPKTRALLFYLVEHEKAHSADIKLDFWPEFTTAQATSNFQATLWRARNALGDKDIIVNQDDQYTLGPHVHDWYDIAEFRSYLTRAADVNISPFERSDLWRQAIEMYQGDYLEDIFMTPLQKG